ncbi:MAG: alpha/beta hydrolase [Anaerolineales bacterium]|nr:alpha/beta hydrolase [Anaerolineales bacterium]
MDEEFMRHFFRLSGLMPFPYITETIALDDALRQSVDGDFVALPDGYTQYELSGDKDVETVVLVHGFSVPYFICDPTFRALTESGYRVLRYDLFGRGYSDRPRTRYDINLFVRQLTDLLDALNISIPINLCGLSMGGAIATVFTARHPERVQRLALFDPAGSRAVSLGLKFKFIALPGVGELTFGLLGDKILLTNMAADFYDPDLVENFIAHYRPQMQIRGFKRAILSTLRNKMLDGFPAAYRRVGATEKPVLLIWGEQDKTVPYAHSRDVIAAIPHVRFHTILNSGHIPHYERADEVNPILLDFLKK